MVDGYEPVNLFIPAPDPIRLAVPKAYLVLASGWEPNAETAEDIFCFCRERLAPYTRPYNSGYPQVCFDDRPVQLL